MLAPWKKSYDKSRQHIKKQRHYFADKGLYSQSYGFYSNCVWMWELDHNEGWVLKNWHFRTAVLEKTLKSPLDSKDIIPVNPKGNQLWIVIGRTDLETEAPILWPPYAKSRFIGKDLRLGTLEGRRRGGWHRMRWLDGITDSVQVSHSVMLDSLRPCGLQHTRLQCPYQLGAYSTCPLSWWWHPTISSSVNPFSSHLQSLSAPGSFPVSQFIHQVAKVLELQLQHGSFQWIFRTDILEDWLLWSPCSPVGSQESSPTPQFKSINSSVLSSLYSPTLTSIHDYWKKHSIDYMDLCWQSNASAF